MRRAMSWEYCAPKSRTTMDWVSTDEFLRLRGVCKGADHQGHQGWCVSFKTVNHQGHEGTRRNPENKAFVIPRLLRGLWFCGLLPETDYQLIVLEFPVPSGAPQPPAASSGGTRPGMSLRMSSSDRSSVGGSGAGSGCSS